MKRRRPPSLYSGKMSAVVLAYVVSDTETTSTIARDLGRPYDHVKRAVVDLRRRGLLLPSDGYARPLAASEAGLRALSAYLSRGASA